MMITSAALILLALVASGDANCGCLKCSKNLQVVSAPEAPVKIIYKSSPSSCQAPKVIPYSVEIPMAEAPTPQVPYTQGYQVPTSPCGCGAPVPPPSPCGCGARLPLPPPPPPKAYVEELVAVPDRIVMLPPEENIPKPFPMSLIGGPIIEPLDISLFQSKRCQPKLPLLYQLLRKKPCGCRYDQYQSQPRSELDAKPRRKRGINDNEIRNVRRAKPLKHFMKYLPSFVRIPLERAFRIFVAPFAWDRRDYRPRPSHETHNFYENAWARRPISDVDTDRSVFLERLRLSNSPDPGRAKRHVTEIALPNFFEIEDAADGAPGGGEGGEIAGRNAVDNIDEMEEVVGRFRPFHADHLIPHNPLFFLLNAPIRLIRYLNAMRKRYAPLLGKIPHVLLASKNFFRNFGHGIHGHVMDIASNVIGDFSERGGVDLIDQLLPGSRYRRSQTEGALNLGQTLPRWVLDKRHNFDAQADQNPSPSPGYGVESDQHFDEWIARGHQASAFDDQQLGNSLGYETSAEALNQLKNQPFAGWAFKKRRNFDVAADRNPSPSPGFGVEVEQEGGDLPYQPNDEWIFKDHHGHEANPVYDQRLGMSLGYETSAEQAETSQYPGNQPSSRRGLKKRRKLDIAAGQNPSLSPAFEVEFEPKAGDSTYQHSDEWIFKGHHSHETNPLYDQRLGKSLGYETSAEQTESLQHPKNQPSSRWGSKKLRKLDIGAGQNPSLSPAFEVEFEPKAGDSPYQHSDEWIFKGRHSHETNPVYDQQLGESLGYETSAELFEHSESQPFARSIFKSRRNFDSVANRNPSPSPGYEVEFESGAGDFPNQRFDDWISRYEANPIYDQQLGQYETSARHADPLERAKNQPLIRWWSKKRHSLDTPADQNLSPSLGYEVEVDQEYGDLHNRDSGEWLFKDHRSYDANAGHDQRLGKRLRYGTSAKDALERIKNQPLAAWTYKKRRHLDIAGSKNPSPSPGYGVEVDQGSGEWLSSAEESAVSNQRLGKKLRFGSGAGDALKKIKNQPLARRASKKRPPLDIPAARNPSPSPGHGVEVDQKRLVKSLKSETLADDLEPSEGRLRRPKRYILKVVDEGEVQEFLRQKLEHLDEPAEAGADRKTYKIKPLTPKIIIDNNGRSFVEINGMKRPLFGRAARAKGAVVAAPADDDVKKKINDLIEQARAMSGRDAAGAAYTSEMHVQIIKEKIGQILGEVEDLISYDFTKSLRIHDGLVKLQAVKKAVTAEWRKTLLETKGRDLESKIRLLGLVKQLQSVKDVVLGEVARRLRHEVSYMSKRLIKVLVRLQKLQCVIFGTVEDFEEKIRTGAQLQVGEEIKRLESLDAIDFASNENRDQVEAQLKRERDEVLERHIDLLEDLKKLLEIRSTTESQETVAKVNEAARLLWEGKNINRLQRDSIDALNQKLGRCQMLKKELKILFDLQKQLEGVEERQNALIGEVVKARRRAPIPKRLKTASNQRLVTRSLDKGAKPSKAITNAQLLSAYRLSKAADKKLKRVS